MQLCSPVKMKEKQRYLNSLTIAGAQQREEDSGDGHVVSGLGQTRVLAACIHRHAPGNVAYWHLVTLENDNS